MWKIIDPRFKTEIVVKFVLYHNGNLGLRATDPNGEPWGTLSVNLTPEEWGPLYKARYQYIAVKNWSENEGVDEMLIDAGIINGVPVRSISSGYVDVPIFALSVDAIDEARKMLEKS